MVAQLGYVELVAEPGAQRRNDGVELVVVVDLLLAHLLDVEHLAPEREYGLEAAVAPVLGAAAGAVALDDVQLGERRVALVAVAELAGEGGSLQRVLAPDVLARLARGRAGLVGGERLLDYRAPHGGVLLEELLQPVAHHAVHQGAHVAVAQLGLGLTLELGVGQLDGYDGGQTLAAVLAGEALHVLEQVCLLGVGVQHAG